MPPEQPNNNVWVSREEYERLRAAANITVVQTAGLSPDKVKNQQIVIGIILGGGLILAMSVGLVQLAVPIIAILLLFSIASVVGYTRAKASHIAQRSPMRLVLLITGIVLAVPIIAGLGI